MSFFVPPGGFSGFSQMTPASKRALSPAGARGASVGGRKRRSKKRRAASSGQRRRKSARSGAGKKRSRGRLPKFGSPAWRKRFGLDKK